MGKADGSAWSHCIRIFGASFRCEIALVATLLVWWCAGVGMLTNTARADDCLTAPNSPAPAGSHWYFRPDRAKQRNCWYLHATARPQQPAAAQATSDAPPATHTITFKKPATASPSAPMSTSNGDSAAPPLPPVKPQRAPMSSATTDQPVQQSVQKESPATSNTEAPAPQASPSSPTGTQGAEPAPANAAVWSDPPAVAAVKAQEPAPVSSEPVRPTAGAQVSDDAESTAQQRWAELHKQREAAVDVCQARFPGDDYNAKTIVAKFQCINQADAIQLPAVPDPDLAQSYFAYRVAVAEQFQNGHITAAQAAAMVAEKRYQLNSEAQRRNAMAQTAAAQQRAADAAAAAAIRRPSETP
jgi:hypothetical protein